MNETTLADIKKGHRAFEVKVQIWYVGQVTAIVDEVHFESTPYKMVSGAMVADYFTNYCRISDPRLHLNLSDRNIPENSYNCNRLFNTREAADAYAYALNNNKAGEREEAKLSIMLENRMDSIGFHDPIDDYVNDIEVINDANDERDRADLEAYYEEESRERDLRQKEVDRVGARHGMTNLGAIMRDALMQSIGK